MIPNSAADRAFLAEPRDEEWAAWCEADVMRRIWGICAWSDTVIEEIACRSTMCRVTVNMPSPGVLASLYTNIALTHLYGDGVSGAEWNELPAPVRRYRAVFYLRYRDPLAVGRLAVGTDADAATDLTDAVEIVSDDGEAMDAVEAIAAAGAGKSDATDAVQLEALFEEIDAKLEELVAPRAPVEDAAPVVLAVDTISTRIAKGSIPPVDVASARAAVRASGTGPHVVHRPRTLTPISAAAVSRAAEQDGIVEITPSTIRSMR